MEATSVSSGPPSTINVENSKNECNSDRGRSSCDNSSRRRENQIQGGAFSGTKLQNSLADEITTVFRCERK